MSIIRFKVDQPEKQICHLGNKSSPINLFTWHPILMHKYNKMKVDNKIKKIIRKKVTQKNKSCLKKKFIEIIV